MNHEYSHMYLIISVSVLYGIRPRKWWWVYSPHVVLAIINIFFVTFYMHYKEISKDCVKQLITAITLLLQSKWYIFPLYFPEIELIIFLVLCYLSIRNWCCLVNALSLFARWTMSPKWRETYFSLRTHIKWQRPNVSWCHWPLLIIVQWDCRLAYIFLINRFILIFNAISCLHVPTKCNFMERHISLTQLERVSVIWETGEGCRSMQSPARSRSFTTPKFVD